MKLSNLQKSHLVKVAINLGDPSSNAMTSVFGMNPQTASLFYNNSGADPMSNVLKSNLEATPAPVVPKYSPSTQQQIDQSKALRNPAPYANKNRDLQIAQSQAQRSVDPFIKNPNSEFARTFAAAKRSPSGGRTPMTPEQMVAMRQQSMQSNLANLRAARGGSI